MLHRGAPTSPTNIGRCRSLAKLRLKNFACWYARRLGGEIGSGGGRARVSLLMLGPSEHVNSLFRPLSFRKRRQCGYSNNSTRFSKCGQAACRRGRNGEALENGIEGQDSPKIVTQWTDFGGRGMPVPYPDAEPVIPKTRLAGLDLE
jgi:hypothetical protein